MIAQQDGTDWIIATSSRSGSSHLRTALTQEAKKRPQNPVAEFINPWNGGFKEDTDHYDLRIFIAREPLERWNSLFWHYRNVREKPPVTSLENFSSFLDDIATRDSWANEFRPLTSYLDNFDPDRLLLLQDFDLIWEWIDAPQFWREYYYERSASHSNSDKLPLDETLENSPPLTDAGEAMVEEERHMLDQYGAYDHEVPDQSYSVTSDFDDAEVGPQQVHVPDIIERDDVDGELRLVDVDELTLHPDNPREGNVEKIKDSIDTSGFFTVLLVQEQTGYVIIGNHRLMAARELGIERVPALIAPMSNETALRILLADNRTGDEALWRYEELAELLIEMNENTTRGLAGTGYTKEQIAGLRQVYLDGDDSGSSFSSSDGSEEGGDAHDSSASEQWVGMPDADDGGGKQPEIHIRFPSKQKREEFIEEYDLDDHVTIRRERVWSLRWPEEGRRDVSNVKLEPESDA